MKQRAAVALGCWLASVIVSSASASEISSAPNDLPGSAIFTAGRLTGTIPPLIGTPTANDTTCRGGTCDPPNQDWLVFALTVTNGPLNEVGVAALLQSTLGMGCFLQGGLAQDGTGGTHAAGKRRSESEHRTAAECRVLLCGG